jgi:hypothetical protein
LESGFFGLEKVEFIEPHPNRFSVQGAFRAEACPELRGVLLRHDAMIGFLAFWRRNHKNIRVDVARLNKREKSGASDFSIITGFGARGSLRMW